MQVLEAIVTNLPVLCIAMIACAVARTEIPFQYGWRFQFCDASSGDPNCMPGPYGDAPSIFANYWNDLAGFICTYADGSPLLTSDNRFTAADCATGCAYEPSCLAWQANPGVIHCVYAFKGYRCRPDPSKNATAWTHGGSRTEEQAKRPIRTDYPWAKENLPEADTWEIVDAPHDYLIRNSTFTHFADPFHAYLPRNSTGWYRKQFVLPEEWLPSIAGFNSTIFIRFEGIFHLSYIWLNGQYLGQHGSQEGGYSYFTVRLDNCTALRYGASSYPNVLAVRVDGSFGSGHWYEGAGMYRGVQLVRAPLVHVVEGGLFASPELDVTSDQGVTSATEGARDRGTVSIPVSVELENHGLEVATARIEVQLTSVDGGPVLARANVTRVIETAVSSPRCIRDSATHVTSEGATRPGLQSASSTTAPHTITALLTLDVAPNELEAWSVQHPSGLYQVTATVTALRGGSSDHRALPTETSDAGSSEILADEVTEEVGFRTVSASLTEGLILNGEAFKLRGFSHHNSFTQLGTALSPRFELYRVQQARAMGANIWRNSHNPYRRELYQLTDRIGMVMWDEHRDYGVFGPSSSEAPLGVQGFSYLPGMHAMVKRDRNRPSIVMASFCNEYACGCGRNTTGIAFRNVSKALAPHLLTAANGDTVGLDVQGHSHRTNSTFAQFHQEHPGVPQVLSECCSCKSQRLPAIDRALPACIQNENSPGLLPYVLGSLGVWTSFDYYGEQQTWPDVSSPFGQFDIAGMPKPHAFWYRANWLHKRPSTDPGKPLQPPANLTRVLDLPDQLQLLVDAGPRSEPAANVRAISTSPIAELITDGKSYGKQSTQGSYPDQVNMVSWSVRLGNVHRENNAHPEEGQCEFPTNLTNVHCLGLSKMPEPSSPDQCRLGCCALPGCTVWQWAADRGCWAGSVDTKQCGASRGVPWVGGGRAEAPGVTIANLTVLGLAGDGSTVESRHTVLAPSGNDTLLMGITDVPSPASGTGTALLLDGEDTALLRVMLADGQGNLRSTAVANVSATIESGPGRVLGVGSGDPACKCQPGSESCGTYGGLARVLVQVTADCVTPSRALSKQIDVDSGARTLIAGQGTGVACPSGGANVVRVQGVLDPSTVPQGTSATVVTRVVVPVSIDVQSDGVLAVARSSGMHGQEQDVGAMMDRFLG